SSSGGGGGSSVSVAPPVGPQTEPQGLCHAEDAAEHEQMKARRQRQRQRRDDGPEAAHAHTRQQRPHRMGRSERRVPVRDGRRCRRDHGENRTIGHSESQRTSATPRTTTLARKPQIT
ncbi:hypothetical protein M9458_039049, partial [Cirrhinus mrigala]